MLFQGFIDPLGNGFIVPDQVLTVGGDIFLLAVGGGIFVHLGLVTQGGSADGGHQALDGMGGDSVCLKISLLGGAAQGTDFVRCFGGDVQHDLPEEFLASAGIGQGGAAVDSFDFRDWLEYFFGFGVFGLVLLC